MKFLMPGLLATAMLAGAPALAATEAELAAPIHQFVDSFNKGDLAGAAAAYAQTDLTIVDELPPYIWRGPGAVRSWAGDLTHDIERRGLSNASLTVGEPIRTEVDGDSAYVIVPAVYAYLEHGKPMNEPARMTYTLMRGPGGWKISSWSWTGLKPVEGPTPKP
jgi:ketosteroid isomerase-like protein